MQTAYTYRQASLADIQQLQLLGLRSYGRFKHVLAEAYWQQMAASVGNENTYRKILAAGVGFVCVYNNKIIGMAFVIPHGNATAVFDDTWAYIRLIGVDPDYAGKRIGRTLTEMCVAHATETGEHMLALHTSEFQNAGRHIYESMGFKQERPLALIYGKQYWLYLMPLTQEKTPITYHAATIDDVQIFIDHRMQFALELGGPQDKEALDALGKQFKGYFVRALGNKSYIGCVARCGNKVAGIGGMTIREQPGNFKNPSGRWGYIMNMYTVTIFRRKKVCTGILDNLIEQGKAIGITSFELHATPAGEQVYRQNGFELHGEPTYRKYVSL